MTRTDAGSMRHVPLVFFRPFSDHGFRFLPVTEWGLVFLKPTLCGLASPVFVMVNLSEKQAREIKEDFGKYRTLLYEKHDSSQQNKSNAGQPFKSLICLFAKNQGAVSGQTGEKHDTEQKHRTDLGGVKPPMAGKWESDPAAKPWFMINTLV